MLPWGKGLTGTIPEVYQELQDSPTPCSKRAAPHIHFCVEMQSTEGLPNIPVLSHLWHCPTEIQVTGAYHTHPHTFQSTWHSHAGTCLFTGLITQEWQLCAGIKNCSTKRRRGVSKPLLMVTKIRQLPDHTCSICWWSQLNSHLHRQLFSVSVMVMSEKNPLVSEEVLE